MTHHIAFLGTGIMGAPMAAKLIKAGFTAAVWNRTRSKTDPLAVQGARAAGDPVDCVKGADYTTAGRSCARCSSTAGRRMR
jgi:3-hydroxyisobutyrate dehydrogenase-like beta-hydroxyacid dehydrogenase